MVMCRPVSIHIHIQKRAFDGAALREGKKMPREGGGGGRGRTVSATSERNRKREREYESLPEFEWKRIEDAKRVQFVWTTICKFEWLREWVSLNVSDVKSKRWSSVASCFRLPAFTRFKVTWRALVTWLKANKMHNWTRNVSSPTAGNTQLYSSSLLTSYTSLEHLVNIDRRLIGCYTFILICNEPSEYYMSVHEHNWSTFSSEQRPLLGQLCLSLALSFSLVITLHCISSVIVKRQQVQQYSSIIACLTI